MHVYDYVHNAPAYANDIRGLKSFVFDAQNCVLTQRLEFEINFKTSISFGYTDGKRYRYEGMDWSEQEKKDYIKNVTNAVTKFWSDRYKLYPSSKSCPCSRHGVSLRLALDVGRYWWSDITLSVVKENSLYDEINNATPRAYNNFFFGVHVIRNSTIRTINHELGHAMGLHHPGRGISKPNVPEEVRKKYPPYSFDKVGANELSEYAHTGKDLKGRDVHYDDLMGLGENLRPFYYDAWKNYMNDAYDTDNCQCKYEIK